MDGCLSNCQYKTAFVFDHGHVRNLVYIWCENSNTTYKEKNAIW